MDLVGSTIRHSNRPLRMADSGDDACGGENVSGEQQCRLSGLERYSDRLQQTGTNGELFGTPVQRRFVLARSVTFRHYEINTSFGREGKSGTFLSFFMFHYLHFGHEPFTIRHSRQCAVNRRRKSVGFPPSGWHWRGSQ